jgi:hypothetical protein
MQVLGHSGHMMMWYDLAACIDSLFSIISGSTPVINGTSGSPGLLLGVQDNTLVTENTIDGGTF